MSARRRVTVEEYELMSEERVRLLEERTVSDLSEVDPAFLERSKADFRRALDERQSLDPQQ